SGGEEEAEHGLNSLRPGGFIVGAAGDVVIAEVEAGMPAFGAQAGLEQVGVGDGARGFRTADVEPYAGAMAKVGFGHESKNGAVVPPDRGGQDGKLAESFLVAQAEIEGRQRSQRGAAEAGVGRTRLDAVLGREEGEEFFSE